MSQAGLPPAQVPAAIPGVTPRTDGSALLAKPKARKIETLVSPLMLPVRQLMTKEIPSVKTNVENAKMNLELATQAMLEVKLCQSQLTECLNLLSDIRKNVAADLEEGRKQRKADKQTGA